MGASTKPFLKRLDSTNSDVQGNIMIGKEEVEEEIPNTNYILYYIPPSISISPHAYFHFLFLLFNVIY